MNSNIAASSNEEITEVVKLEKDIPFNEHIPFNERIPLILEYRDGDILLLPIPSNWSPHYIEDFKKYIVLKFPEFKDIRLIPDMYCAQILRKSND